MYERVTFHTQYISSFKKQNPNLTKFDFTYHLK